MASPLCHRILLALVFLSVGLAAAQEVPFTPRHDAISPDSIRANSSTRAKKTQTVEVNPARAPKLHSLARFNPLFMEMCQLLELEQRRERIQLVAKTASDDEQECPSCRAFARQIAQSCAPKPRMKKATKRNALGEQAATPTSVAGDNNHKGEDKLFKRYPRTDLIDVLSRLSEALYQDSPGQGPGFTAIKSFERRLFAVPDLAIGEREYFGIVIAYLYSAWAGRPGSPLEIATPSPAEVAELFNLKTVVKED